MFVDSTWQKSSVVTASSVKRKTSPIEAYYLENVFLWEKVDSTQLQQISWSHNEAHVLLRSNIILLYKTYEKAYNDVGKTVSAKNTKDHITKNCQKVVEDEEKARKEFLNTHPKEKRQEVDDTQVERELEKMQIAASKCFAAGKKNSANSLNAWNWWTHTAAWR